MRSKLTGILVVLLVIWVGYRIGQHVSETKAQRAAEAEARNIVPEKLPGVPWHLESSLRTAQQGGSAALRTWLERHGSQIQDPRKAWIQLDLCRMLARDNPREARELFAAVKARTRTNSPVYPRIQDMSRTFE